MKKIVATVVVIAACGALCAFVWPQSNTGEKVPAETAASAMADVGVELTLMPEIASAAPETEMIIMAEKENQVKNDPPVITPETESAPEPAKAPKPAIPTATATTDSSGAYHTDVYPENVYSEEYLYDTEGNLIGKTTTIPTVFGPDTVWIDGHAYYNAPGFELVEWSGAAQVNARRTTRCMSLA